MRRPLSTQTSIFFTTLIIAFVQLVHNGTEPLFLFGLAAIPLLILFYYRKPSLSPLIIYLVVIGVFGRMTRYLRQNYASDTLLALRDFIGYFVAGRNVYAEHTMAQTGNVPFTYLPFALFWYLPSYVFSVDYRFFEMLVSSVNVVVFAWLMRLVNAAHFLPALAVLSFTPFLLDLSADGSTDNSASFLLITSVAFLVYAIKKGYAPAAYASAVFFACANAFKHYLLFVTIFFVPYMFRNPSLLPISNKRFFLTACAVFSFLVIPFIIASPQGFLESLTLIEMRQGYNVWGWNVWLGLKNGFGVEFPAQAMWLTRTIVSVATIMGVFILFQKWTLSRVFIAAGTAMLAYLVLSAWTTYAYFTFLLTLFALAILTAKLKL